MKRRDFLQQFTLGTGAVLTLPGLLLSHPRRRNEAGFHPAFDPDVEIALKATPTEVDIFRGDPTRVWQFQAELVKGPRGTLQPLENTYLGPIIRVRKGQRIRIRFTNDIPEVSIVHWHGLDVPAVMDGHPRYVIPRGKSYVYEFEIINRAGTYWYHPHPHGRTGPQVYYGMAGFFLVSDAEEDRLPLPRGEYDIPLVIQDRRFDRRNQLVYLNPRGGMMGGNMERMRGFLGDQILVNGQPDFTLSAATRAYRLRILNGSNSRIYKLAWSDGSPMVVIGTDGGLLEKPLRKPYIVLGPGQRLDIWADFRRHPVGKKITLRNLSYSAAMAGTDMMGGGMMRRRGGMMGMMGRRGGDPETQSFDVLTVSIDRKEDETLTLPDRLTEISRYQPADAVNADHPRQFRMLMRHMTWTINGRTFEMTGVARDEVVRLNTLEQWQLINSGGGRGMMGMGMNMALPHPIHLHGRQFQVLNRTTESRYADDWQTLKDGVVEDGWQDVVVLFPGQAVNILREFALFEGMFLYHCHNLEHEDMGMMRNYLIKA